MNVQTLTPRKSAADAGFCIMDANADVIARNIIERLAEMSVDHESQVNRLYRGRDVFTLSDGEKRELAKLAERFAYIAKTTREVLAAQAAPALMAAE